MNAPFSPPFGTVCLVGLGYIGLPTAVVFALRGVNVLGLDVNQKAVDSINRGESHIVEPGLQEALQRTVAAGHLRATTTPEAADAFLIAVPTPFLARGNGHEPDMRFVEAASRSIAPVLKRGIWWFWNPPALSARPSRWRNGWPRNART